MSWPGARRPAALLLRGWLLLAALLPTVAGIAQTRIIRGTVTDARGGEPLIGVRIVLRSNGAAVLTDVDGAFSLAVPAWPANLSLSYAGYVGQEIEVDGAGDLKLQLQPIDHLDERVALGYGVRPHRALTDAVRQLEEGDFNLGNITDPWLLVQGRIPGLLVARPGSDPNGMAAVRLRGLSTLQGRTRPLVVVDDVVGADLQAVDPADIAEFSVLRSGSAAAMFGARGASGVVLVKTKRGTKARPRVSYRVLGTVEGASRQPLVLDAEAYRRFGGSRIQDFGSDTNWQDQITRTAWSQTHHLALSGGTGDLAYRASMHYRDNQGVLRGTGFAQINGRLNLQQHALHDRLRLDLQLSLTDRTEQLGFEEAFRYATIYNPTAPIRDPDDPAFAGFGGYFQQLRFDFYNPVALLEQNRREARRKIAFGSLGASYELLRGLRLSARYGLERSNRSEGSYFARNSFWVGAPRGGLAERRHDEQQMHYFLSTLGWTESLGGDLTVDLLGGYEWQAFGFEGFGAGGGNFITDAFSYHNLGAALDFPNGLGQVFSYKNAYRNIAFFGRAHLAWDDAWFLSASLRREGNSRFGEDQKWAWYPAVSGAVDLSRLFPIPGTEQLRLRAGWGRTGSIPAASYQSLQRYAGDAGLGQRTLVNGAWIPIYSVVSNPNPGLGREVTDDFSMGVDLRAAGGRLTGSVDLFWRYSRQVLFPIPVPVPPNLYFETETNVGELRNTGLEWSLAFRAVDRPKWSWTTGLLGAAFGPTRLENLSTDDFIFGYRDLGSLGAPGCCGTPLFRVEEGKPVGEIWGPQYLGVDADGRYVFADVDGDGVTGSFKDRTAIGNGLPDFQLGWTNQLRWGRFDLAILIDGVFGHDLINEFRTRYEAPAIMQTYNALRSTFDSELARLTEFPRFSDLQVERASFLRLHHLALGYTIDSGSTQAFSSVRVYLVGERLFYLTGYQGSDPEVRFQDGDGAYRVFTPGIDRRNSWFRSAALSLGGQFVF